MNREVIILCGDRPIRWHEAPPTFFTMLGSPQGIEWRRGPLVGEHEGVPMYRYHLVIR